MTVGRLPLTAMEAWLLRLFTVSEPVTVTAIPETFV